MNKRSILLCGLNDDPHLLQVSEALQKVGQSPTLWNSRNPAHFDSIQWRMNQNKVSPMWDAIWVRHMPPLFPSLHVRKNGSCDLNEIRKQRSLRSFFLQWLSHQKEIGVHLLPNFQEGSYDQNKGQQLQLAQTSGLPIPRTCCTNNLDVAMTFIKKEAKPCVVKPLLGGTLTQPANETNIADMLRVFGPVMVQERVHGKPCRVLWLNDRCLGAFELPVGPSVDWRSLFEEPCGIPSWRPVELPVKKQTQLHQFAKGQLCQLLGFDLIHTKDDFVFLEANTSPAWCDLPPDARNNISKAVAQFLL